MTHSSKTIRASRVTISQLMHPEHANLLGNIHGGWIMKLVDEAGALACMRHAQRRVVTVAVDSMTFRQPIKIGDLVTLTAEVTYTESGDIETDRNRLSATSEPRNPGLRPPSVRNVHHNPRVTGSGRGERQSSCRGKTWVHPSLG